MKIRPLLHSIVWLLLSSSCVFAEDSAVKKGMEIALEVERRDSGWQDSTAALEMVLLNKRGDRSVRQIDIRTLEVDGDGDKSLSIFHEPRDVEGTAFLSFSHAREPDQQWLYLPALKRVKRIASANKSGPFMGSEFAFEDLSSFEIEKFDYEYLRDEVLNDTDCFVVKYTPLYEHSGYKFQQVWIDKNEYRLQKIEYYDRKGSLLKTLSYSNFEQYLGQYWRALNMKMVNHQSEKITQLTWSNMQFKTGLTDAEFNSNSLRRAR